MEIYNTCYFIKRSSSLLCHNAHEIYDALEKKPAEFGHMIVHGIITDIVRKRIFMQPVEPKKGNAARPRKVDERFLEYFSRKE